MNQLWVSALSSLRARLSEENFQTWLGPVECDGITDGRITLRIPNRFYAEWITSHYLELILEAVEVGATAHQVDGPFQVDWVVDSDLQKRLDAQATEASRERRNDDRRHDQRRGNRGGPEQDATHRSAGQLGPSRTSDERRQNDRRRSKAVEVHQSGAPQLEPIDSGLNPRYQFDNFIVGPSNQLAHAASSAAASSPGGRYNPLFIYGGVGLGKTHLVNAIGHRIRQENPNARVLFLSCERFTNEFIWALQNHRIAEFRRRYRTDCDVLCIDDIQFLAGREQTQEEFFHTFNALYHADRQIVVTSDAYPAQIKAMKERLISRFQWGMVADIQPPELETRIAILKKKAEQEQIQLSDEVALTVAQHVASNVRELEGTLLRLAVKAELLQQPIDVEFAREALGTSRPKPEKQASVEDIQRAACDYFNIRLSDIKSHRRHRNVSHPRMIAMYVCRQRLKLSYPELGDRFGGKDHTTVMNAVKKIGGLIDGDEQIRTAIDAIERKVGL